MQRGSVELVMLRLGENRVGDLLTSKLYAIQKEDTIVKVYVGHVITENDKSYGGLIIAKSTTIQDYALSMG